MHLEYRCWAAKSGFKVVLTLEKTAQNYCLTITRTQWGRVLLSWHDLNDDGTVCIDDAVGDAVFQCLQSVRLPLIFTQATYFTPPEYRLTVGVGNASVCYQWSDLPVEWQALKPLLKLLDQLLAD